MSAPREFTDFSDYPQNGFGLTDIERDELWENRVQVEDVDERDLDEDYPRRESCLSENIVVVKNDGSGVINCTNEKRLDTNDSNSD